MILLFIYFWLCPTAFGILVPWLLESNQCPFSGGSNHQTSRKVLDDIVLNTRGTIVLICVKTSLITQISNAGDLGLIPGSGRSLRRRKWQSIPVLLPGKFREWRSQVGYCPWGRKESDTTERLHFCGWIIRQGLQSSGQQYQ